jgi:hypothetical protein
MSLEMARLQHDRRLDGDSHSYGVGSAENRSPAPNRILMT